MFVLCKVTILALHLGYGGVEKAISSLSNILNGYIVPEYEMLHTQSREYIVDDLLDVMKERGVEV